MDTSKQAISASLIHFVNLLLSIVIKDEGLHVNQCVRYFLNIALDTTFGVYILYLSLGVINSVALKVGVTDVEMGNYGDPPRLWVWLKQLVLFLIAWSFVKLIVTLLINHVSPLQILAEWILSPLSAHPKMEIAVVLFIFPLIMNIVQYWITDNIIKSRVTLDEEVSYSEIECSESDFVVAPLTFSERFGAFLGRFWERHSYAPVQSTASE